MYCSSFSNYSSTSPNALTALKSLHFCRSCVLGIAFETAVLASRVQTHEYGDSLLKRGLLFLASEVLVASNRPAEKGRRDFGVAVLCRRCKGYSKKTVTVIKPFARKE